MISESDGDRKQDLDLEMGDMAEGKKLKEQERSRDSTIKY